MGKDGSQNALITHGSFILGVKTTDDGGDLGAVDETVQINNQKLSVSTSLTAGQALSGTVDLTSKFTVQNNDGNEIVYEYSTDGGSSWSTVSPPSRSTRRPSTRRRSS
ncbi:hypothetical protein M0R88_16195 [Halorussus gelatinilyticus]|uniref:Uncharacterized protein n=1 Tax=Halorussus gelatinilyticus TaxID=2937524 RepID=A0A8U0IH84_9EURY|nr:hypothetical protein [Halorussus gelatinilyticus]UPW00041.1 hypothetical protein M0R88_16195 [Halorussus gelatinilyticus]